MEQLLHSVITFSATGFQLDQVNDLFKAPFTTDISIIKQDNHGHFTQVSSSNSE